MINPIILASGLILLILAIIQDFKTRKPTVLIPALMVIGLSINVYVGGIISILGLASLYLLPNKVNKVFGKADLYLMASLITIILLAQNIIINQLVMITCVIMIIYWFIYLKATDNKLIPFVGIFGLSFFTALILNILFYMVLVI
jgi:hypothetical protein